MTTSDQGNAPLLTVEQLAAELNVPPATIRYWRYMGTAPVASKLGRHVRFRREDVDSWLESRASR